MDLRKLKTLIDLVSDSNVTELEITEAEGKVRIVKGPTQANVSMTSNAHRAPAAEGAAVVHPSTALTATSPEAPAPDVPTGHTVKSPMVGTFYRSATPGAAAFVKVGDVVKEGQTLCIIEAMKILNEIESDKSGTVTQILCENGQAVEYGQAMIIID